MTDSTQFHPTQMSRMFEEGRRQALTGTAWRNSPPGVLRGENLIQRAGTKRCTPTTRRSAKGWRRASRNGRLLRIADVI